VVDEAGSALGDGANRVGAVEGGGGQEGETRRDTEAETSGPAFVVA
jgi:hypothetical protein